MTTKVSTPVYCIWVALYRVGQLDVHGACRSSSGQSSTRFIIALPSPSLSLLSLVSPNLIPSLFSSADGDQSKTLVDVAFFILVCLDYRLVAPFSGCTNIVPQFRPPPYRDSIWTTSVESPSPLCDRPPPGKRPSRTSTGSPTTTITTEFTFFPR